MLRIAIKFETHFSLFCDVIYQESLPTIHFLTPTTYPLTKKGNIIFYSSVGLSGFVEL